MGKPNDLTADAGIPVHFVNGSPLELLPIEVIGLIRGTFGLYVVTPNEPATDAFMDRWKSVATLLILAGARAFWLTGPHAARWEDATDAACVALEQRAESDSRSLPDDAFGAAARGNAIVTATVDEQGLLHQMKTDEGFEPFELFSARVVVAFSCAEQAEWYHRLLKHLNRSDHQG